MPIEEDEHGTAILSSRDICMMEHLPRLMESGVCCFKIEGRNEDGDLHRYGRRRVSAGDGRLREESRSL